MSGESACVRFGLTRSSSTVITAVNDEGGEVNVAFDAEGKDTIPNIMKRQKAAGQPWMLVVDQNCELEMVFPACPLWN